MNELTPITITAVVSQHERALVEAATAYVANALGQVTGAGTMGAPWPCSCAFAATLEAQSQGVGHVILLTSMTAELDRLDEPWAEIEGRLRKGYAELCGRGDPVFICTILRHVGRDADPDITYRLRVRLRRLNLLAAEISREYGAFIIDLDRVLADIGARRLQANYRLQSAVAIEVAARAIATGLIVNALDAVTPVEVQDGARDILARDRRVDALPSDIKPVNLMRLGTGRHRPMVSTVTDMVQSNQVGWLIRQVLSRKIGPAQAISKIVQSLQRRGVRESFALLTSALPRPIAKLGFKDGGKDAPP
jgi:hypothetical protein